jgi:hypothetical protein
MSACRASRRRGRWDGSAPAALPTVREGIVTCTDASATQRTFDVASGLVLSSSSRVHGAAVPVIEGGAIRPAAGSTQIITMITL